MKHLQKISLGEIVFLDIETARVVKELEKDTPLYESWAYLMKYKNDPRSLEDSYREDAALFPEFAKVLCITVGRVKNGKIKLTTYGDENERTLLENFNRDLGMVTEANPKTRLAGHAIIDFDIPFILKRCIINWVPANELIDNGAAKPWEVTHLDTKVLWKSSGQRASSLINIAVALGIPSPKSDISGADVGHVYYEEGAAGLARIIRYCEKDVITTINVYLRINYMEPINDIELSKIVEVTTIPIIEKIKDAGFISAADNKELVKKFKTLSSEEKVIGIEVLKGALAFNKAELSEELQKKLLK